MPVKVGLLSLVSDIGFGPLLSTYGINGIAGRRFVLCWSSCLYH